VVLPATMGPRGDKRDANQLRPLACEVGVLERADGSARFSQGHSCVLASVVGPGDVSVRDEVSHAAPPSVPFAHPPAGHC
jgi:ribonuclease PH